MELFLSVPSRKCCKAWGLRYEEAELLGASCGLVVRRLIIIGQHIDLVQFLRGTGCFFGSCTTHAAKLGALAVYKVDYSDSRVMGT